MSDKIYNAWKLPSGDNPLNHIKALRELITPVKEKADLKEIINHTILNLDTHVLGKAYKEFDPKHPMLSIYRELEDHDLIDNNCEFVFMVDPEDPDQHYAVFLSRSDAFEKVVGEYFDEHGWVDYHYQNSTDKPDDISDAQWDQRKDTWDRIIGYGPIYLYGAVFTPALKSVSGSIPAYREHLDYVDEVIEESSFHRLDKLLNRYALQGIDSESSDYHDVMSCLFEMVDAVEAAGEAGDQRYLEAKKAFRPITRDDMTEMTEPTHTLTLDDLLDLGAYLVKTYGNPIPE